MTSIYNSLTKDVPLDLAWREQVQQKTTEYFKSGRNKLENISPDKWKTLKEAWRSFVQERCRTVFEYAGKPMEARIIKETKYDRFRVQKIVFEPMPGWETGLNLFLPLSDGPYLPVICPCGHSQKWNNDHQIPPQVLAVNGFAAALFDMPGCGERSCNNSHFIQGAQTAMVGIWSNHFFLIDAVRSADYLQTRGDMDFSRGMAVTGVSGGGFATAFMAVIDSRVKVSVPVCSVAPFGGSLIEGLYTGCPENFMKAQALIGLDYDHLICLASPVPCLIIGGTGDLLFKPEQVKKSFEQAKRVYRLEGEADKLSLYLEDCGHSYTASMAHTAARWIRRWLMNDDSEREPVTPIILPEADLNCGTAERTRGMLQYVQAKVKRLKQARNVSDPIKAVAAVLGIDPSRIDREKIALEHLPEAKWGYPHLHRALIRAERDLAVPFIEAVFPDAPPGALVCFTDTPATLKLKEIGFFFNMRRQVISADARGFGELEPRPSDYDIYSWCSMDRSLSDLLCLCGESSLGAQTGDVLRVLHTVQSESILIYGKGEAALPVLFAGILNNKVRKIILDSFLGSFEALAVEGYPSWKRYQYLQDVLKSFDIPEILAGCADKQFLLMNPLDAQKRQLNQEQASSLFGLGHPNITLQVTEDMAERLVNVEKPYPYCVSEAIRKWSPC